MDFATIDCISPLRIHTERFKRIPQKEYDAGFSRSRRISAGSVLCTIKRRICQAYPFITAPKHEIAFNQDIALLVPEASVVSAVYLATYLGSSLGQSLANREQTEQMNPYLSLIGLGNLPIIPVSKEVEEGLARLFVTSSQRLSDSQAQLGVAERLLLEALGLLNWSPPEPLTYTRSSAAMAAIGRFDAEFAAPKVQALIARLSVSAQTIADVADVRRD